MKFTGLSAFPLTPVNANGVDEKSFITIISRLNQAQVDSIGVLGSTGSYAYLNIAERAHVARLAIDHAHGVPVMVGIGATSTRDVLTLTESAQKSGASAVMLAPVSYQKLSDEEVYGLYEEVSNNLSVPLCVYDNPGTTNFIFSDELHAAIAQLLHVASIKIPPVSTDEILASARVSQLRKMLPPHVSIGISGDWVGLNGLKAGCDLWYSAIGGLLPAPILQIVRSLQNGDDEQAARYASKLMPLFELIRKCGSVRVTATAAEILGIVDYFCLPRPLKPIAEHDRLALKKILSELGTK